uniref:Ig-like domain-containing protein n=1 Tax=Suricata suricatta TaxID=37032 RepID=A0A673T1D1_SURSU
MGTRLLYCAALCLLGAGHTGAGVIQSPRSKVTRRGWDVTFRCDPISGHTALYWYQQAIGQGPEVLTYFQGKDKVEMTGMPKNDRFHVNRSEGTYSTLQIQRAEPGDSAVYLCASSPTTVGHSRHLPLHKPQASLSLLHVGTLNSCLCSSFPDKKG